MQKGEYNIGVSLYALQLFELFFNQVHILFGFLPKGNMIFLENIGDPDLEGMNQSKR